MVGYRWLADAIVVVHGAYAAFVVAGLVAVLVGMALGWRWIRSFWFRSIHLAMIALVALEALLGLQCPLTVWEDVLREKAGEEVGHGGFIERLAEQLLFYDAPAWIFACLYCATCGVVLLTFLLAPPHWPWAKAQNTAGRAPGQAR